MTRKINNAIAGGISSGICFCKPDKNLFSNLGLVARFWAMVMDFSSNL
jgi:hypothetical protein